MSYSNVHPRSLLYRRPSRRTQRWSHALSAGWAVRVNKTWHWFIHRAKNLISDPVHILLKPLPFPYLSRYTGHKGQISALSFWTTSEKNFFKKSPCPQPFSPTHLSSSQGSSHCTLLDALPGNEVFCKQIQPRLRAPLSVPLGRQALQRGQKRGEDG